jgi:hypothetical protein
MARSLAVADAIVTALNGETFGEPFTAVRAYRPLFDLEDMSSVHVTVVPRELELVTAGRLLTQTDMQIDVGVQQKLTTADNDELDKLMDLVQDVADFIALTRQFGGGAWLKTENRPIYSQEHMAELRQFTSVLTLTLRVLSEVA